MATPKKPNSALVSLKTDNIEMKFNGTISACTIQLFESIMPGTNGKSAADVRAQSLKIMQGRHDELVAKGR